jgi:hypothetical protein
MPQTDPRREAALRIVETSRLLRSLVEQRLRPFGMTRAQLSTLARLERQEGLVQNELAELLEAGDAFDQFCFNLFVMLVDGLRNSCTYPFQNIS